MLRQETCPLLSRSLLSNIGIVIAVALVGSPPSSAAGQASDVPAWLQAHIGEGDGQIAPVVLNRPRALYLRKVNEGAVDNPCYFAMDATRPHILRNGQLGRRFYAICEADQSFRAVASGHGSGRTMRGVGNFKNGRRCAKHFSNAMHSKLMAGGVYVTSETRNLFKGYYRVSGGKHTALVRSFVQFDGEGDTANARPRAIGGHPAVLLRGLCRRKYPSSPHANDEGYVPFGKLVNYAGGRSNGCTSWTPQDAAHIVPMMTEPAALYIYPESHDIDAVAYALKAGRSPLREGLYWNASCLKEIRAPKFWPRETLEPILVEYKKKHPPPPPRPLPICRAR